ncbi:hypothetical protein ES705_44916 [subsurface metagenome]
MMKLLIKIVVWAVLVIVISLIVVTMLDLWPEAWRYWL